jgi:triacylglycerol esterase/lipase EstA (alpha/beta hydrolase family)
MLVTQIPLVLLKFGVKHIHIVCHSKGGLDTRAFLKFLPTEDAPMAILSMTTLSTPHHGSALADYVRDSIGANARLSDSPLRVYATQKAGGAYDKGRQNLTTDFVEKFNSQNLPLPKSFVVQGEKTNVQYFTIGADANANDSFVLGRPTIDASELAGTGQTSNAIFQYFGGSIVYRMLYDVASTSWAEVTENGKTYKVVVETQNATGEVNDMLVTVTSSKREPEFNTLSFNPPLKRNHATIGDHDMGQEVLSLIKAIQPVQW